MTDPGTQPQGPTPAEPRRMRPWQRWLLVLSLGFNLLILGIVAGAFFDRDGPIRAPGLDLSLGPMTRALPEDGRRAVMEHMRAGGYLTRDGRDAMRADTEALLQVLRAERFDAVAAAAVLDRQRGRVLHFQDGAQDAFLAVMARMSLADRRAFADRLQQELRSPRPLRD